MKAGIFVTAGKVELQERPMPEMGPRDVLFKPVRSGICGSDVTGYKAGGRYVGISDGAEFGHETAGYIYKVGSEVEDAIKEGMRVYVNPMTSIADLPPQYTMMFGGFSEYALVRNAKINYNVFPLADNVSFDEAAITEPFCVATHGKNQPQTKKGEHVVVYGAGTIGLCAMCGALNTGAERPVVIDLDSHRLDLAREMGAATFNPTTDGDVKEFLSAHFGASKVRRGLMPNVDVVIEAAGAPTILPEVMSYARPGLRYSQIAVPKAPIEFHLGQLMSTEAVLIGSCGYTLEDTREVLDCLTRHNTQVEKIITHHFPLEQIGEAFKVAIDPAQSIKVLIDME